MDQSFYLPLSNVPAQNQFTRCFAAKTAIGSCWSLTMKERRTTNCSRCDYVLVVNQSRVSNSGVRRGVLFQHYLCGEQLNKSSSNVEQRQRDRQPTTLGAFLRDASYTKWPLASSSSTSSDALKAGGNNFFLAHMLMQLTVETPLCFAGRQYNLAF